MCRRFWLGVQPRSCMDLFQPRRVLGWQVATTCVSDWRLDALEIAGIFLKKNWGVAGGDEISAAWSIILDPGSSTLRLSVMRSGLP